MLQARRKSDHQIVTAYLESKANGPFLCVDCGEVVTLKTGARNASHFAHANPLSCRFGVNESDEHRRCKIEIFEALKLHPDVQNAVLERPLGTVRPDVSAYINGVPVAIEVQISFLSLETITQRTIEYFRKGIHVLWLLPWKPELENQRYTPKIWEKWIHAAYFGNVYYWLHGLSVVPYRFEASLTRVPKSTWYAKGGKKMRGGGYSRHAKRYRTPSRGEALHLVADFGPQQRYWWEGNGLKVPDAKLFMHRGPKGGNGHPPGPSSSWSS